MFGGKRVFNLARIDVIVMSGNDSRAWLIFDRGKPRGRRRGVAYRTR